MKPIVHGFYDVWVHGVDEVSLVEDHVLPPDIGGKGVASGAIEAAGTLVMASRLPRGRGGDQRRGTEEVGRSKANTCNQEQIHPAL